MVQEVTHDDEVRAYLSARRSQLVSCRDDAGLQFSQAQIASGIASTDEDKLRCNLHNVSTQIVDLPPVGFGEAVVPPCESAAGHQRVGGLRPPPGTDPRQHSSWRMGSGTTPTYGSVSTPRIVTPFLDSPGSRGLSSLSCDSVFTDYSKRDACMRQKCRIAGWQPQSLSLHHFTY